MDTCLEVIRRHQPLRAFRLGIVPLAVGATAIMLRTAAAQLPPQSSSDNPVPVRGATPQAARLRGRISCESIISQLNQDVSRGSKGTFAKLAPEKRLENIIADIAQKLGTTRMWVVRCMQVYGRRLPASIVNVQDDYALEELEEQEPEESAPEDLPEPGERERDTLGEENSADRQGLKEDADGKEHVLKRPTPEE